MQNTEKSTTAGAAAPIAIVGMSCRLPGAGSPDALWKLLCDHGDAITEVPPDRFPIDRFYDPEPGAPGGLVSRYGGFLPDIAGFDAAFFGISPREAMHMDPQHRILLETAWEAFEDGRLVPGDFAGTATGVFVGQLTADYWSLLVDARALDVYANVGNTRAASAGRLSHAFDLRGPSMEVDTACSSSLVALHLACQSLRRGECAAALVGAINLILHPWESITFSSAGMLSADGRCKFGSAAADGFVRSDGVAAVVLKPLADAVADGDRVRALIRGSAVANDGRSGGHMMTPGREGQLRTLRAAYRAAGVDPAEVGYVEAHGTGTPAGDPVEVECIREVVATGRTGPLHVGSVKTNIGHTEATAGLAGLIKTVLAMEHRMIPASLHSADLNPGIDWGPIVVPQRNTAWPETVMPTAGVSSFGISGTNAHVIISAAEPPAVEDTVRDGRPRLVVASGRSPEAARWMAAAYAASLTGGTALPDLARSAAVRRQHHDYRITVVGTEATEVAAGLRAAAEAEDSAPKEISEAAGRIVFVFPGQGSQWLGMGREMLETSQVFREQMARCDDAIRRETGWSVTDRLRAPEGPTAIAEIQPMLWAMQVAISAVWGSWGVEPDLVIGHSMGEVAAAHVAGVLDLADAAAVICRRSALLHRIAGQGAMAVVELPAETVERRLAEISDDLTVAASNSPGLAVIAGPAEAISKTLQSFEAEEIFCRPVNVDVASHSAYVDPLREDLLAALAAIRPSAGSVALFSTVRSEVIDGTTMDAAYWCDNLRRTVRFSDAVGGALDSGHTAFLEMSPHPVLTAAIQQCVAARTADAFVSGSLHRDQPEQASMLEAAGGLWRSGHRFPLDRPAGPAGRFITLPPYPWQRQRYWFRSGDLPGQPGETADIRTSESAVSLALLPYLEGHRVQEVVTLPGTAYAEALLTAGRPAVRGAVELRDIRYRRALFLTDGDSVMLTTDLRRRADDTWDARVSSRPGPGEQATTHVTAIVAPAGGDVPADSPRLSTDTYERRLTGPEFYARMAANGNQWTGAFQGIAEIGYRAGAALARVVPPAAVMDGREAYAVHPALLDACAQVAAATAGLLEEADPSRAFVLDSIEALRVHRTAAGPLWSQAVKRVESPAGTFTTDLRIVDEAGAAIADIAGLCLRYLDSEPALAPEAAAGDLRYELAWQPQTDGSIPASGVARSDVLVFAAPGSTGAWSGLRAASRRVVLVTAGTAYRRLAADRYQLDPADPDGYRRLLADAVVSAGRTHLVYQWASPPEPGTDLSAPCSGLLPLIRALAEAPVLGTPRLWLVTRAGQAVDSADGPVAPDQAAVWGLGRSIAQEHPEWQCSLIDLDGRATADQVAAIHTELLRDLGGPQAYEDQIALRGDVRYVARLRHHRRSDVDDLPVATAPDWAPGTGEVEIRVRHAGPSGSAGNDAWGYAGTVTAVGSGVAGLRVGEQVVALAPAGLGHRLHVPRPLAFARPSNWSSAEAATLPVAFLTAYRSLAELAALREGERVLIHAAVSDVGLAAIQLARWKGAEIYATAGSAEHRALLLMLGVRYVGDSGGTGYVEEIQERTGGDGVDVVLNSLSGPAAAGGFAVLRPGGRYVELAGRDRSGVGQPVGALTGSNIALHRVDVADLIARRPELAAPALRAVLDLARAGVLTPLPHGVLNRADAAGAAQAGKLVPDLRPVATTPASLALRADATYLVTGGLGGLGRLVARWLAGRGARHLILTSRSGGTEQDDHLADLTAAGTRVSQAAVDVADGPGMRAMLAEHAATGWPPVRGVIHAAGVLSYRSVDQLEPEHLTTTFRPKAAGAVVLAELATELDFLVYFSSASAVIGSPMLGAYAAANAALDGLAHMQRRSGVPVITVNWGFWGQAGMAARHELIHGRPMMPRGMRSFTPEQGLAVLNEVLTERTEHAVVLAADWQLWAREYPDTAATPLMRELLETRPPAPPRETPRKELPAAAPRETPRKGTPLAATREVPREPASQAPPDHGRETVGSEDNDTQRYLTERIADALGLTPDRLSMRRPLRSQGLDSLTAMRVRNDVKKRWGVHIPVARMLSDVNVAELVRDIRRQADTSDDAGAADVRN